jgi:hypothetical protein
MTEHTSTSRTSSTSSTSSTSRSTGKPESAWTLGAVIYGSILLMLVGIFQAFVGLAAILDNDFYPSTRHYLLNNDVTAWGWVHLGLGIVIAVAGFNVLGGRAWARIVGIIVAAVSAINNFLFLPHHPVWSILIIALDVSVIWALSVYRPQDSGDRYDTGRPAQDRSWEFYGSGDGL